VLGVFLTSSSTLLTKTSLLFLSPQTTAFTAFLAAVWLALDNWTLLCDLQLASEKLKHVENNEKILIERLHNITTQSSTFVKLQYTTTSAMHWALIASKARAIHYIMQIHQSNSRKNCFRLKRHSSSFTYK
jgi:hypothetical protein